jgi:hypothetical protein
VTYRLDSSARFLRDSSYEWPSPSLWNNPDGVLRAEEDHDRGTLTDARRQTILEHINDWVDERLELMTPVRSRFGSLDDGPETTYAILCVPASDRADEVIAKLFEAALIERKLSARIIEPGDDDELAECHRGTRAIVVSALPPEAVTAARAVCKRVRVGNSEVPVFVGLWNAAGDLDRARQRLTAAGATRTVVTFAECFALLETLVVPGASPEPEELPELGPVTQT